MVYPTSFSRHISHPIDPFSDRVEPLKLVTYWKVWLRSLPIVPCLNLQGSHTVILITCGKPCFVMYDVWMYFIYLEQKDGTAKIKLKFPDNKEGISCFWFTS